MFNSLSNKQGGCVMGNRAVIAFVNQKHTIL